MSLKYCTGLSQSSGLLFYIYIILLLHDIYLKVPQKRSEFVSLKIWVESFSGNSWSELLRFTATENNCCSAGDRIPAIFVNSAGYIHVTSQVGSNGNFAKNVNIKLKTWIKVDIKQYPENGKVILFRI